MANYSGTTGNDVYDGTDESDTIHDGGGGNDSLGGGQGADTITITGGSDTVAGGDGSDRLIIDTGALVNFYSMSSFSGDLATGYTAIVDGSGSNDIYLSGFEHFTLNHAGTSSVTFFTGDGDDVITTGSGNDLIRTGRGMNIVDTGAGIDSWGADLTGETENLLIDLNVTSTLANGGSLVNAEIFGTLIGGSGNDTLTGTDNAGADSVSGGDGNDVITLYGRSSDTVSGGAGSDRLKLIFGDDVAYVSMGALSGNLQTGYGGTIDGSSSNDVYFDSFEHFDVTSLHATGNGTFITGDGNDRVSAGGGNDTMLTGGGIDVIDGGDGVDLWGADKSNVSQNIVIDLRQATSTYLGTGSVTGVEGFANFTGGSGDDRLTSTEFAGAETLNGGDGNDVLTLFGIGVDNASGGAGSDRLAAHFSAALTSGVTLGSLGGDFTTGYSGVLDGSSSNDTYFDGIEHFTLSYAGEGTATFTTGGGNDVLTGGAGNDLLNSGAGVDRIDGGDGVDRWGADMSAATQNIVINLSQVSTFLGTGRVENVEGFSNLKTGSGNDRITSTSAALNETIDAGGGNDVITLFGYGVDGASGGEGSDRLVASFGAELTSGVTLGSLGGDAANGYSGVLDGSGSNDLYFDGIEHFTLSYAGGGTATFTTGAGNDILTGGSGNDILNSGAGVNQVDGGDGIDRWGADMSSATQAILIDLNGESDFLNFGSAVNVEGFTNLLTGSGNDRITGTTAALNDGIDAGGGDDIVTLFGLGSDTVAGGLGDDRLVATFPAALTSGVSLGSLGGDFASGYSGLLDGSGSNDLYFSGIEHFTLTYEGNVGINFLTGDGRDSLTGGNGNDSLRAGLGDDTLQGGVGNDTLQASDGNDTVSYTLATAGVEVSLLLSTAQNTQGAGTDTLTDFENIRGSDWNDTLTGSAAANRLEGGLRNDSIVAGDGDDTVAGGGGNDTLEGGVGAADWVDYFDAAAGVTVNLSVSTVQTTGGSGNDRISGFENGRGSAYADLLIGTGAANVLEGADGQDSLRGGSGADTLRGGLGDDLLEGAVGNDRLEGGDGIDQADYSAATSAIVLNVSQAGQQNTGGGGNDTLIGVEGAVGSAFADSLTGAGERNRFDGGEGNDTLVGAAGNDTLNGGGGADSIVAGIGSDVIDGGAGIDTLDYSGSGPVAINLGDTTAQNTSGSGFETISNVENVIGTDGADTLTGSSADNRLTGGGGADSLNGGGANDTLDAGSGNDQLLGGNGLDTLLAGFGSDAMSGGGGIDLLDFSMFDTATFVDLRVTDLQNTRSAGMDSIIGIENVTTGGGDDRISGSGLANVISTFGGLDTLNGRGGDDLLQAGTGADSLNGGVDNDTLVGGAGADILRGGFGTDVFDYNSLNDAGAGGPQRDVIKDFRTSENDKIDLSDLIAGQFAYIGNGAFGADGDAEVRVGEVNGVQIVQIDHNGDGAADLELAVTNAGLTGGANDFVL